jgi:hypothetical protein
MQKALSWCVYAMWWLAYIGIAGLCLTFAAWLLVGHHWIAGTLFAVVAGGWTIRVIVESHLIEWLQGRRAARRER